MLGRLSAAYTYVGKIFGDKRYAAGTDTRLLLNLVLTFLFAAPHSLYKAVSLFGKSGLYLVQTLYISEK